MASAGQASDKWPGGEEANTAVCKTAIRGCESLPGLREILRKEVTIKFQRPAVALAKADRNFL